MEQNKPKKKPNYLPINILTTVFAVLINIFLVLIAFGIARYSGLGKMQFLIANAIVLVILLVLDIVVLISFRSKKINFKATLLAVTFLLTLVFGYGFYAITRVNSSISKITNASAQTESVEASVIVYDQNQNFVATAINGLDKKKVGYANGTKQYDIAQNEIKAENITPEYQGYENYTAMLLDLFSKKIDAAIVPSNYATSLFNVEESFKEYLEDTKEIARYDKKISVEATASSGKDLTKEPFTVLLIGTADGLSDSMMLCSVNPISLKVTMSSIARDSYVPISCYNNSSSKLNSARAVSRECLINTIENLVGVDIDYYVETNFQGVVQMVDALDGIVVNNPYEFVGQNSSSQRGKFTVWVPAGENVVLNGEQALAFARERHLYATGDFQRQANQQQVIQSIIRKIMRTRDLNVALDVLSAAGDNVQTNFTLDQLTGFFNYVMKKASRYYNSEHVESIFEIAGSRITGYSSGLWDEGLGLSLYIYRLYQGSIADTKAAILRNLNQTTDVTAEKFVHWKSASEFYPPTISHEAYAEKIIAPEVPTAIANYVGNSIGKLTSWAKALNLQVNIEYVAPGGNGYDANVAEGTVIAQDIAPGTPVANIGVVNVRVITHVGQAPTPTPTADINTEEGCKVLGKYWYNNKCNDQPQATPDVTTQQGCQALGKYWYNNQCNDQQQPATPNTATQQGCEASGKYWYNNVCNDVPKPACPNGQKLSADGQCYTPIPKPDGCTGQWNEQTGNCICPEGQVFEGGACKVKDVPPAPPTTTPNEGGGEQPAEPVPQG